MKSVLFVCLGNICRSPAAERCFARFAKSIILRATSVAAEWATGMWGGTPDARMHKAAMSRGYSYEIAC